MTVDEDNSVPLERDHYWWLHPALRGREALPPTAASALPWRWSERASAAAADAPQAIDPSGPYADFAKLLYKMNGYRPGLVTGWYVVVEAEPGRYAVGQLEVDPNVPVVLFGDLVFDSETEARSVAAELRAANPGLVHKS